MVSLIALCTIGYIAMILVSMNYIDTYQRDVDFWRSNCLDLQEKYNKLLNDVEKHKP